MQDNIPRQFVHRVLSIRRRAVPCDPPLISPARCLQGLQCLTRPFPNKLLPQTRQSANDQPPCKDILFSSEITTRSYRPAISTRSSSSRTATRRDLRHLVLTAMTDAELPADAHRALKEKPASRCRNRHHLYSAPVLGAVTSKACIGCSDGWSCHLRCQNSKKLL